MDEEGLFNTSIEEEEVPFYDYNRLHGWDIFSLVIKISLSGVSTLACILLIYVIRKFNYLKTRVNLYILHWAICFVIFIVPYTLEVVLLQFNMFHSFRPAFEIFNQIVPLIRLLEFTFCAMLSIDWLLVLLNVSFLEKYEQIKKYVIVSIYCAGILQFLIGVVQYFQHTFYYVPLYVYVIPIEITITISIVICVDLLTFFIKPKKNCVKIRYALVIANTFLISFCFELFYFWFYVYGYQYHFVETIRKYYTEYYLRCLELIVACELYFLNDGFRKAYRTVFRCKENCDENDTNDYECQNVDNDIVNTSSV